MKTRKARNHNHLAAWLTRADQYFGRTFVLRFEVLAQVASGTGTLAAIARRHMVSRQAVHKYAVEARKIFGVRQPGT